MSSASAASVVERLGVLTIRYGLVAVILWIGLMKFTHYEAVGISGLVENSPLLGWVYGPLSVDGFSRLLGVVELGIAVPIAMGRFSKRAGAIGAALAVGMFLTTLSFLLTTPGAFEASLGGFPALAVVPGQFLLKDLVLLGASLWLLGVSLRAHSEGAP